MTKFTDLNLNPKVLKAIEEAGYESPTPIQAGAIPAALEGRDVLGIAQTGTGKTASFTLPMITRLARGRARARMPRSLVLCPTRELAAQVAENFDTYAKHVKLTKALLIGGVSFKEQDAAIDRGVDVLIATPGRLLDHFERGKLLLTGIEIMVVDEADRMLDMGFIPDIERIFSLTPFTRQTLFFSATMAPEIERITNTFLSGPERVEIARQATTSETIEQAVVMFKASRKDREGSEKRRVLRELINQEGEAVKNAIIFCNRKTDVDIVAKSLKKYGYDAAPIHGDLDQSQRTKTLDGFRDGALKILVASDVAARGLDVPSVSHVFNFDVPGHAEDYVHRIGRTGRAGRDGKAITICTPRDEKALDAVEGLVQKQINRLDNPVKPAPRKAAAKDAADAPETTDKPKPSRRSRSRGGNSEAAAEAQTAAPTPAPAPEQAAEQPTTKAANKSDRADKQDSQKSGKSRGRGRKDDRRDDKVVGMGDHMPSFIALSFDERRAS
ncbi:DEAD/DEAH box helicase [Epibacterium sp. Ofav1-8]|uniref:DEAD/DEAH box helicase n=1 Tax=Epibacterium sp. Ofav1-8 TaxID=2917735 RepID=UPI001EF67502|nr:MULTISPECIES: DEAD/DEAH box helicase [Bacteria]MCG7624886.1 DEAD/DEAH box helicase [Epibacterium sp. Ofav1-8]MEB3831152.1 DEAD/DEAH box helicase [Phormidium sp. CCY1219]